MNKLKFKKDIVHKESEDKDYLKGKKFTTCYVQEFKDKNKNLNKWDSLEDVIEGSVLHIGCADHNKEQIDKKIKNSSYMHQFLCDISNECYGVDIDCEAINYLKSLGYSNLYCYDAFYTEEIPLDIKNKHFDYVFMGDILEHFNNPYYCISYLKKYNFDKLIITVPNAFSYKNFLNNFKNVEKINSDHRTWWTPYTLSKILTLAGYRVLHVGFVHSNMSLDSNPIFKRIFRKWRGFMDSVILIAEKE